MKYIARSMHQAGLPNFTVSGGTLTSRSSMGWHITTDKGFTIGVACDQEFAKTINDLAELKQENTELRLRIAELEQNQVFRVG